MQQYKDKKVLFITTKNLDYLRNTQEINLLKQSGAKVDIIGSAARSYPKRLIKVYWELLWKKCKCYDVFFVGFAPQLIVPFFKWKFAKKELVIDFFISMYDTFVFDRKKFKQGSLAAKLLKWLDTVAIHPADTVIVDTKAHGEYFVEEFGASHDRLKVLYLEADKEIFYPRPQEKPERMQDTFTVLYFGSILPLQGLDVILEAIALLKENAKLYFIVVGPIQDKFEKPMGDNVEYHDWLSQEELAQYISFSDLCLAGHFNKEINKALRTIPGKAYIYEAMEKPMVLGDNRATRELYQEDMPGIYFVEMGNAKALAEKITEIAQKA